MPDTEPTYLDSGVCRITLQPLPVETATTRMERTLVCLPGPIDGGQSGALEVEFFGELVMLGSQRRKSLIQRLARVRTLPEKLQSEERLRFVAQELCHRNKNLLGVVQAIANQIAARSTSLEDFRSSFSKRLHGLSRSLDLLVEDVHGAWIGDLVRSQVEPFGAVDGVRITATGAAFFLHADAAQSVGLALYELATNASKHGALSVPGGTVCIRWEIENDAGEPTFRLLWVERNGPTVTAPTQQGFGTVVLQRMAGQAMHGKVDHRYDSLGVSWTLEVPTSTVEGVRILPRLRRAAKNPPKYIPTLVRTLEEV